MDVEWVLWDSSSQRLPTPTIACGCNVKHTKAYFFTKNPKVSLFICILFIDQKGWEKLGRYLGIFINSIFWKVLRHQFCELHTNVYVQKFLKGQDPHVQDCLFHVTLLLFPPRLHSHISMPGFWNIFQVVLLKHQMLWSIHRRKVLIHVHRVTQILKIMPF